MRFSSYRDGIFLFKYPIALNYLSYWIWREWIEEFKFYKISFFFLFKENQYYKYCAEILKKIWKA